MTQKAVIVRTGPDGHEGLETLNIELERGWRVAQVAPMGGASGPSDAPCHAALVILEHHERNEGPSLAVEALEQVEEDVGDIIDAIEESREPVEGDGAGTPNDPTP